MSRLVLGVGNRSRGDDGVGPEVAERVAALDVPGVRVVADAEPVALVELLATYDEVVVVDATVPGVDPGSLHVQVVGVTPMPRDTAPVGSHGLGVPEAVELARALGRLPRRLTLLGVEAVTLEPGAPLSDPVAARLDDAVAAVLRALRPSGAAAQSEG